MLWSVKTVVLIASDSFRLFVCSCWLLLVDHETGDESTKDAERQATGLCDIDMCTTAFAALLFGRACSPRGDHQWAHPANGFSEGAGRTGKTPVFRRADS